MGVRLGVHAARPPQQIGLSALSAVENKSPTADNSSSLFRGRFPNGFYSPERLLALVRPAFDLVCEGFEV